MSCCGGGGSSGSSGNNQCCNLYSLMTDPCYQKLCCNQRKQVCYKPFVPSYERVYGQCGGNQRQSSCCPPPCQPPVPRCCGSPCSVSPCCPAPRLTLCQPDSCNPCCRPMKPCPPRCPPMPCFPKVCCPPPCIPDPCIKPSRKCFIPPPCCPPPCCKKMALVVSPPICPPRCCPPLPCCPPDNCRDPCQKSSCCGAVCPSPAMIVRPIRNNCCPPPPKIPSNNQCPIPCCNPLPPCCVIVKPCQPKCPPSPCCPPPPMCAPACPQPDPRCCPRPIVASFCCPTSVSPMAPKDACPQPISWPSPPKIDMCCSSNCPPKERDLCFMTVRPMPPKCCPAKPSCGGTDRLCCRPRWNDSPPRVLPWSVDLTVPPLAPLSARYNCWISNVGPSTDNNFWPSRFSSRVENACCQLVGVDPPVEAGCGAPCPCH